jgi:hypothetical protein
MMLALAMSAALSSGTAAQGDEAAYCSRLAYLALRYTGSAGAEGRLTPSPMTRAAIEDCNRGNTAAGIAVLEKLLRSNGFTLPPR